MMRLIFPFLLTLFFAPIASAAGSINVKDAWVRLPPPGSQVGAAYLTLEPKLNMILTSAKSPVAKTVELHSMSMNDGVMQMRHLDKLTLEAGKAVKLEPGGLHLMLIDLNKPLKIGDKVPLDLKFTHGKNSTGTLRVVAVVRSTPQ
jgi:periplasmic copper chaperone A